MELTNQTLHWLLISHLIKTGQVPDIAYMTEIFECTSIKLYEALNALQSYHGCALSNDGKTILSVHPFSTRPTNFKIVLENNSWWGNCAWCALGVVVLIGGNANIKTNIWREKDETTLLVRGGKIENDEYLAHFPVPMGQIWNNVIYSCSTMQVFRTENQIDEWCDFQDLQKGDVQPISVINRLANKWYVNHADKSWNKWTNEEASAIFQSVGLTHSIWGLDSSTGRF